MGVWTKITAIGQMGRAWGCDARREGGREEGGEWMGGGKERIMK